MGERHRKKASPGIVPHMSQPQQRRLHPLEGIVAICALFFVLALTVGFAQAEDMRGDFKKVKLRSANVLVMDSDTGEVVFQKNSEAVVPIASITKLMTAIVTMDKVESGGLDMDQRIVLTKEDVATIKRTRSRLRTGATYTRDELMLLGSHGLLCHEQAELEWSQRVGQVADALQSQAVTA